MAHEPIGPDDLDAMDRDGAIDFEAPTTDAANDTAPAEAIVMLVPLVERARALRARCPVVRIPTGLETLDANCRGGLRVGTLTIVGGAPGAGKTALVVQLAHEHARIGVPAGVLAGDEGADDILMRLAVREGFNIDRLESGDPAEWDAFSVRLEALALHVYDADDGITIEGAAEHFATITGGKPSLFIGDSAQTLRANGAEAVTSKREELDLVIKATKQIARAHPWVVMLTSELARGAYRNRNNAENINELSAFKESGGIEYGANTALVLRSVPGGEGRVDVVVPKNRGGQKEPFYLEIDPRTTIVREVPAPCGDDAEPDDRDARKVGADAAAIEKILVEAGEVAGIRGLRAEIRTRGLRIGNTRLDAAILKLGKRIGNRGTSNRPRWFLEQGAAS